MIQVSGLGIGSTYRCPGRPGPEGPFLGRVRVPEKGWTQLNAVRSFLYEKPMAQSVPTLRHTIHELRVH